MRPSSEPPCPHSPPAAYAKLGGQLNLRFANGSRTTVSIDRFKSNLVYVVRTPPHADLGQNFPPSTQLILKVFDATFYGLSAPDPAAKRRGFLPPGSAEATARRAEQFRRTSAAFVREVDAYERLAALQGRVLARFYGSGELLLAGPNSITNPDFILLEYVPDAARLDKAAPSTITGALARSMLDAVRAIGSHGVAHHGVAPSNVLVSPSDAPTRVVVINFSRAIVRTRQDSDDDEWDEESRVALDLYKIRKSLQAMALSVRLMTLTLRGDSASPLRITNTGRSTELRSPSHALAFSVSEQQVGKIAWPPDFRGVVPLEVRPENDTIVDVATTSVNLSGVWFGKEGEWTGVQRVIYHLHGGESIQELPHRPIHAHLFPAGVRPGLSPSLSW
ncbi:hypothetical protein FA95DRAFT_51311 [Auriscalpium vulgare]|uniref:Uncharacterized protein n=1 Tax=Auriscalpium vulgare TaxID=40419 RepID=A0ACB8S7F0_9AGAM|nr:hypothetical protein FA95DRAFT_51311 [Auriscalpium vulgare]